MTSAYSSMYVISKALYNSLMMKQRDEPVINISQMNNVGIPSKQNQDVLPGATGKVQSNSNPRVVKKSRQRNNGGNINDSNTDVDNSDIIRTTNEPTFPNHGHQSSTSTQTFPTNENATQTNETGTSVEYMDTLPARVDSSTQTMPKSKTENSMQTMVQPSADSSIQTDSFPMLDNSTQTERKRLDFQKQFTFSTPENLVPRRKLSVQKQHNFAFPNQDEQNNLNFQHQNAMQMATDMASPPGQCPQQQNAMQMVPHVASPPRRGVKRKGEKEKQVLKRRKIAPSEKPHTSKKRVASQNQKKIMAAFYVPDAISVEAQEEADIPKKNTHMIRAPMKVTDALSKTSKEKKLKTAKAKQLIKKSIANQRKLLANKTFQKERNNEKQKSVFTNKKTLPAAYQVPDDILQDAQEIPHDNVKQIQSMSFTPDSITALSKAQKQNIAKAKQLIKKSIKIKNKLINQRESKPIKKKEKKKKTIEREKEEDLGPIPELLEVPDSPSWYGGIPVIDEFAPENAHEHETTARKRKRNESTSKHSKMKMAKNLVKKSIRIQNEALKKQAKQVRQSKKRKQAVGDEVTVQLAKLPMTKSKKSRQTQFQLW
jgi:hypothetical protein